MQVFITDSSLIISAANLDNRRLNKQIIECGQIIDAINHNGKWSNHPVVHMWRNYISALYYFMAACQVEALSRGINVKVPIYNLVLASFPFRGNIPPFIGDGSYIYAMRARLLAKDTVFYRKHGWFVYPLENEPKIRMPLYDGKCKSAHGGAWNLQSEEME